MLKREWGAESNGKLQQLFVPAESAALVPEFAVEDLPLAELQPWFLAYNEVPALGQNTMMMIYFKALCEALSHQC